VSGGDSPLLAFQCKLAVVRWIGPDLAALTRQLGAAGCRRLLIVPVSFTCEHIETLHVLDRNLAATATGHGVTEFQRISALNLDEGWLSDLARLLATRAFGLDAQP
jgi:ferrochelatase